MASEDTLLGKLIQVFARCMTAAEGSPEEKTLAREFNTLLDQYLKENLDASIGTVAAHVASLGIPHEQALIDLMYVRQLEQDDES